MCYRKLVLMLKSVWLWEELSVPPSQPVIKRHLQPKLAVRRGLCQLRDCGLEVIGQILDRTHDQKENELSQV